MALLRITLTALPLFLLVIAAPKATFGQALFFESDAVIFEVPGEGFTRGVLFDRGGPQFTSTPFFETTVPSSLGLGSTVVQFVEPTNPTVLSDLLAMKVTPISPQLSSIALSFWSDNAGQGPSADQFLASLGLTNANRTTLGETGQVQDVRALLFPVAQPPLNKLLVASPDVPGLGIPGVFGESDDLILHQRGQGQSTLVSFHEPGVEAASAVVSITTPLPATPGNVTLAFIEAPAELFPDPTPLISDYLAMTVTGNCATASQMAPCTITFSAWSEDPSDPDAARFLSMAGVAPPITVPGNELQHPPIFDLLFPDAGIRGALPFDNVIFTSDPPSVPEPGTLILLGFGVIGLSFLGRRR